MTRTIDDPMAPLYRAQLVKLEVDRLLGELARCSDPSLAAAIRDELDVLIVSLRDIHREQLIAQITDADRERRPWWRRWGRA